MKLLFLVLLLEITFISCTNKTKHQHEFVSTGKTISISLTNETKCFSNCVRYFRSNIDSQFVVLANLDLNRIEFYHWNSGKLSHMTNLLKEGPDGIGSLRGFEIITLDSILVFNGMTNNGIFYMVNANGKILKKYEIISPISKYPFVPLRPSSVMNCSVVVLNDSIAYVPSFVFFKLDKITDLEKCKLLARVNLNNGKSTILNLSFPLLYNRQGNPVGPDFSSLNFESKWIFSFAFSNDIYVSNELSSLQKIKVESKFISKDFLSNSVADNWNIKKILSTPLYKSFYHDSINKVYYRFVKLGDDLNSDKDFVSQNRYPNNFSVIILNENFEVIGETKMPIDRYVMNMSFMSEEGLFISTSNIDSPEFDEDHMKFELFTIK